MERMFPISWSNRILCSSTASIVACCVVQAHINQLTIPIHYLITWTIFVLVLSIWSTCYALQLMLKINAPIDVQPLSSRFAEWLEDRFQADDSKNRKIIKNFQLTETKQTTDNAGPENLEDISNATDLLADSNEKINSKDGTRINVDKILEHVELNFIQSWYRNVSNDATFPMEAKNILRNLILKTNNQFINIDRIEFARKIGNILLLHFKEYRRALRRVEKKTVTTFEEAYRYSHPGSRSSTALDHSLLRVVTVLAREFLQWELISSLPCKLLFSILAKKLLSSIKMISSPRQIFGGILKLASTNSMANEVPVTQSEQGVISSALGGTLHSTTAAVMPRSLPKNGHASNQPINPNLEAQNEQDLKSKRASLTLEGLEINRPGLWADKGISEVDSELDEDRLSPVYEEPTDLATTIARLRNLLHHKSASTTPVPMEEKSCTVYEGSHLAIPRTEFHTALDGSQQLLYCIQFDDIEQHGSHMFETTTATVKRQHSDFAQLHTSLEEVPSLATVMSDITLPEGGRAEMENYLKLLCTRFVADYPPQLRHFLRPSSSNKKADTVAPRLDRFLAKTVSGVFNTLKTVVPGFEMDTEIDVMPMPTLMPLADVPWRFIQDTKSTLANELQQLVAERIDFCSVDAAYEAVDSMEGSGDSELLALWWQTFNTPYDEELEELDSDITLTQIVIDLTSEILVGAGCNNAIEREVVVRSVKLFAGRVIETVIESMLMKSCSDPGNWELLTGSENEDGQSLDELKAELLAHLMIRIPPHLKIFLGDGEINSAFKFLINSFEHQKVNEDLSLQILDVFASQLLASSKSKTNQQNERNCDSREIFSAVSPIY